VPVEGDAADRTGDEGERTDTGAGNESEVEYPFVADRIRLRTDESYSDDEMAEGKPVCAVGHEGIVAVGDSDAFVHAAEPAVELGFVASGRCRGYVKDAIEGCGFLSSGNAVTPLSARPMMKSTSQMRMRSRSAERDALALSVASRVYVLRTV